MSDDRNFDGDWAREFETERCPLCPHKEHPGRICDKQTNGVFCFCGVPNPHASAPEVKPVTPQLIVDLARELYDRFVMGGWEPQDAYGTIEEMLSAQPPTAAGSQHSFHDAIACENCNAVLFDGKWHQLAAPSQPRAPESAEPCRHIMIRTVSNADAVTWNCVGCGIPFMAAERVAALTKERDELKMVAEERGAAYDIRDEQYKEAKSDLAAAREEIARMRTVLQSGLDEVAALDHGVAPAQSKS